MSSKAAKAFDQINFGQILDIAACSCSLPMKHCIDRAVVCQELNGAMEHIACECLSERRLPKEEGNIS